MARRFSIPTPRDYLLKRDYCSYGYFLLAPNHWDPESQTVVRTLGLDAGAVTLRYTQPGRGEPILVLPDRPLSRAEIESGKRAVSRMLRLDEDQPLIAAFHKADPRWKKSGRGRLMRSPSFFEDVVKTVTSCNVTWPSTVSMNTRLCRVLGERSPSGHHAFPSAERLARIRPATLRARCGVGYRDQRIIELAKMFTRGEIKPEWFENPQTPDADVRDALLELPGIGPYAAHNIMQLLGRYSHLPLDTESIRHAKSILGMSGSDRELMKRLHAHYAPFGTHAFRSYWLELWEFYESKQGPAWTWEREKTAKAFTAAMLKEKLPSS
jgi:3-methyladenine DNA glycosylase/8-oxoguanine DNA glycosylase